jgi:RNA polymerase sigma-70 factor (ECF subfamily)
MHRSSVPELSPEALHRLYAVRIEQLIHRVLGPDSEQEDLRQDVLVTVFGKAQTVRDLRCLDSWVARVTFNTLNYTIRRRRLRRHASWDAVSETSAPRFQPNFETREIASRAVRVIEQLPGTDRSLLMTYWFTSESVKDIAARSGCSMITVRRRLSKARRRFELLASREPELARCLEEAAISSPRSRSRS